MRRGRLAYASVALVVCTVAPTLASPSGLALATGHRLVDWTGGPLSGTTVDASDCSSSPTACEDTVLTIAVGDSYWVSHPGGVVIRVEWTAPETELDLHVYGPSGEELAAEVYGGRHHQQVYLHQPTAGDYHVHVAAFAGTAVTYTATARIVTTPLATVSQTRASTTPYDESWVDPQVLAIEPGVAIAPNGDVYVNAPWGTQELTAFAWRSSDGGATFRPLTKPVAGNLTPSRAPCLTALGGADSDLAVDRNGRLYFATLQPTAISVATSTDRGRTWDCHAVANSSYENDRPWLAVAPTADGTGRAVDAYLVYMDLVSGQLPGGQDVKPVRVHVDVTRDGGASWTAAGTVGTEVPTPGAPVVDSHGTLLVPYVSDEAVWLAESDNNGRTFTTSLVSNRYGDPGNSWVSAAVDAANNRYVGWVDSGSQSAQLAKAPPGRAFGPPMTLTAPGHVAMLPWLTAGAAGDVAMAWYDAPAATLPDFVAAGTPWKVWLARTHDADSTEPSFDVGAISDAVAHVGPLCSMGCTGSHSRLGDFLRVAFDHGHAVVAYADNSRVGDPSDPAAAYLVVARERQTAAPVADPAGDAAAPLDLVDVPQLTTGGRRLTLRVSDARALANALDPRTGRTDAYWLAVWTAGGHVDYAGLHLSVTAGMQWIAGDAPTGIDGIAPVKESAATYPAAVPASGTIDASTGILSIRLDRARMHLRSGIVVRRLQAFTLVGRAPHSVLDLLTQADATPAHDAVL